MEDGVNDQLISYDKSLLNITRLQALEYSMRFQQDIKRRYAKRVKQRTFQLENWVSKKVVFTLKHGKHDTNWKGPYVINEIDSKGVYFIWIMEGKRLTLSWDSIHPSLFNK